MVDRLQCLARQRGRASPHRTLNRISPRQRLEIHSSRKIRPRITSAKKLVFVIAGLKTLNSFDDGYRSAGKRCDTQNPTGRVSRPNIT